MKDLGIVLGKGLATIALIATIFGCGDKKSETTFSGKIGEENITLQVTKELSSDISQKTNYPTIATTCNYTLTAIGKDNKKIVYYWNESENEKVFKGIEIFDSIYGVYGIRNEYSKGFYSARDDSIAPVTEKAKLKLENYLNKIKSKTTETDKDRLNQALEDLN